MAKGIDELLHDHGAAMVKHAKDKYYYYILTQSLYYSLGGRTRKSIATLLKSLNFNLNIKNNLITIFILILLSVPTSVRCKLYIYIKNINYNYT